MNKFYSQFPIILLSHVLSSPAQSGTAQTVLEYAW